MIELQQAYVGFLSQVHGLGLATYTSQQKVNQRAVVLVKELVDRGAVLCRRQIGRGGLNPTIDCDSVPALHVRRHPVFICGAGPAIAH